MLKKILVVMSIVSSVALTSQLCADDSSSNMRFIDNNDGTISDIYTGLMWKSCSEGQVWVDERCLGSVKSTEYEVVEIIRSYGEYSDWRVPTSIELDSIVQCKNPANEYIIDKNQYEGCSGDYFIPTIHKDLFPQTRPMRYWSSTLVDDGYFENVSFRTGAKYTSVSNDHHALRLVRNR